MGLKGISWFEQNVEKVVVGVFGVALLGVIAYQFVGKGNQVELGTGANKRTYPYSDVWGAVRDTATATHSRITSADPDPEVRNFDPGPGLYESFTGQLRGAVSPRERLEAPLDQSLLARMNLNLGSEGGGVRAEVFAALSAPAPSKPTAAAHLATIHPQELLTHEDLLKAIAGDMKIEDAPKQIGALLPKLDRAGVSVETTFDGTALETALAADPDGDGPAAAFPRHWWDSGRVQVLGVEMERQEMLPTGEWSAAVKVGHMPGRLNLLKEVEALQQGGTTTFAGIMQEAARSRREVLRPAYYSILLGEEWVPPTEVVQEVAGAPEGNDRAALGKRQLASVDREIGQVNEQLQKLQEEVRPGGRPPTTPPPGGGGKGGGGRPPSQGRDGDQPTQDPKQQAITRLQNRLNSLLERRQRLIDQYAREGIVLEERAAEPGNPAPVPTRAEVEVPLLANDAVRVWAHDINVERGKTYRYRMSLVLNNPIYAKTAALGESQAGLAKDPVVRTPASPWSDPVRVDPDTYYFITSASPEDGFAPTARASAEVFYFSMGYWRKGQVNLEPGDTIVADVRVPDPEKLAALIMLDPNQQPGVQPGGVPPIQRPGERGIPPGGPGRGVPGGDRPPMPIQPGGVDGQAPVDPATILVQRTVEEDAMLLDVATTTVVSDQGIAKTKTENQAFLLNEEGRIVVRTPEGDRNGTAYAKLSRSAELGEEALRPKAAMPTNMTPRPVGPSDPAIPGRDEGGGGGGGG